MHLLDDSGLSSSDSEVDAHYKDTFEGISVKTDVIKKTETGGNNNKDLSNPFEESDNDEEDTVLDHINLSGELDTGDSKNKEEKVKTRSTNESGERRYGEGGTCDENILEDTKDILEAEETEDCKNKCEDTAGPLLQIDTCEEENTKPVIQPDVSEEVSKKCEVSDNADNTPNKNVSSSESVTVKHDEESDSPKEATNDGHTEDSGRKTFSIEPHTLQSERIEAQQHVLCLRFCNRKLLPVTSSQFLSLSSCLGPA